MSRQRVTGMRIPSGPRPTRTGFDMWFHRVMVIGPWVACGVFLFAGEPWAVLPFALIGFAYLAADVHS